MCTPIFVRNHHRNLQFSPPQSGERIVARIDVRRAKNAACRYAVAQRRDKGRRHSLRKARRSTKWVEPLTLIRSTLTRNKDNHIHSLRSLCELKRSQRENIKTQRLIRIVTFQVNSPTPFQVNSPTYLGDEFTRGMASYRIMLSTSCLASSILLFDFCLSSSFLVLMNHLKRSPSVLWECGYREAVSKPLWEVWESRKTFPCFPQWRHFHEALLRRSLIRAS